MKLYEVEYWILTYPEEAYDNRYILVWGESKAEALSIAKHKAPKTARHFKIIKIIKEN